MCHVHNKDVVLGWSEGGLAKTVEGAIEGEVEGPPRMLVLGAKTLVAERVEDGVWISCSCFLVLETPCQRVEEVEA